MKRIKIILLSILLIFMSVNIIVADNNTATISWDENGDITYTIPGFDVDDLINYDLYYPYVVIEKGEVEYPNTLNNILTIDDLLSIVSSGNITITIIVYDLDEDFDPDDLPTPLDNRTFVIPTFYLDDPTSDSYVFELAESIETITIDTVEITGNEIDTKQVLTLNSDLDLFSQLSKVLTIKKEAFKDFSSEFDEANITFISNGVTKDTVNNHKLSSSVLKDTITNINFNVSNDSNNIYVSIDDNDYIDDITYVHVYTVDANSKSSGYEVGKHKGYGTDVNAYDLTNEKSLLSLIDVSDQEPLLTLSNTLSIPIPEFAENSQPIAIDIYSDGYVTSHNYYTIPSLTPSPKPKNEGPKEAEEKPITCEEAYGKGWYWDDLKGCQFRYSAPNTSVK